MNGPAADGPAAGGSRKPVRESPRWRFGFLVLFGGHSIFASAPSGTG